MKLRGPKRGDYLFAEGGQPLANEKLAEQLRADLTAAGVDRRWPANGKSESSISDRTGHGSSVMINRYRRPARTAEELGLGPLAPLDPAIPELAASGFFSTLCRRWESNPHSREGNGF